jgi:hypothetical protein
MWYRVICIGGIGGIRVLLVFFSMTEMKYLISINFFFSLSIIRIHSPFVSILFPFVSNRRSWLWRRRRRTEHDPGGSGAEDTQVPSGRTAWAEGSLATRTAKCGTVQLAGSMATPAAALPSRLARPMRDGVAGGLRGDACPRDPRGQV